MKTLLVFIASLLAVVVTAQINFPFVPRQRTEYGTQTLKGYTTAMNMRDADSVVFFINDYKKGIRPDSFVYKGSFKNNLFNGYGELMSDNEDRSFKYAGMWKDGKMHGIGRLTRYKRNMIIQGEFVRIGFQNLIKNWGKGYDNCRFYEFKGNFINGVPAEGLYIAGFNFDGTASTFYSGDVKLEEGMEITLAKDDVRKFGTDIIWHGFGTLYRTSNQADQFGAPGAYYSGQFWKGSMTGFGISNTLDTTGHLSNLKAGICIADRMVHVFNTFDFGTQWLGDGPVDGITGNTLQVLPMLKEAVPTSYNFTEGTYKGGVLRGAPYGPGIVIYRDGFMDIGFWQHGEKLKVKNLLARILPDSTVLNPTVVAELGRSFKSGKPKPNDYKGYRGAWSKLKYWIDRDKKRTLYYSAFTDRDEPSGWGWKVAHDDENAEPELGFFNGRLAGKRNPNNADTMFVQCEIDWKKSAYWGMTTNNGYVADSKNFDYFSKLRAEKVYIVLDEEDKPIVGPDRSNPGEALTQQLAYSDDRIVKQSMVDYILAEREKFKQAANEFSSLPRFTPKKLVIDRFIRSNSYITDDQKKVVVQSIDRTQLRVNDYLLIDTTLKLVSYNANRYLVLDDNTYPPATGTVYIIRGYQLVRTYHEWTCPLCNGTGGSVTTVGTQGVVGFDYEITDRTSTTVTITKSPVYIKLPGIDIKTTCKHCNGKPHRKVYDMAIVYK